ncbi:MAG: hypothetical protein ABIN54_07155 [candidate division WOR-3 bacterium]
MSYIIAFAIAAGIGPGRASSATGINPSADSADVKATPPVIVNFQGHLRQGMNIVNGTYSMTFRLYDAAAGGNLLQTMGPWNVNVANGVFNVELPITQANILNYTNLWIEVEIPGLGGIYSPRVKINSAAFAYNAFMSDSTQRIRNKGVTPEDLMMSAANPNQAANFDLNANGRIDAALLDVPASGTDPGYIWNQFASAQTPADFWISGRGRAGSPTGMFGQLYYQGGGGGTDNGGVYGQHSNTTAYGYLGVQNAVLGNVGVLGNGGNDGVFGQNNADYLSGAGVEGYSAFAASGIGGLFTGNASASSYVFSTGGGVYGTGTNYGVAGFSNTTATNGAGVRGTSLNAASGIGVVGAGNNLIPTVPSAGCGVAGTGDTVGTFGYATLAGGMGVWGVGANASSNGVYGQSPGTNAWAAIEGFATNSAGMGINGIGNNLGSIYYPSSGAGVVGNGTVLGVVGYGINNGSAGVYGTTFSGTDALGASVEGYTGTMGNWAGYFDAPGRPSNTAIGAVPTLQSICNDGGYAIAILGVTRGGGLIWSSSMEIGVEGAATGNNAGIGVLGYNNGGSSAAYAGYFYGDVYVSGDFSVGGAKANVIKLDDGTWVEMYANESPYTEYTYYGTAKLNNGEAHVTLEYPYPQTISDEIPVKVIVTPVGSWSGIYVVEANKYGFTVKCGAGDPNATFNYQVVGRRKGYENHVDYEELTATREKFERSLSVAIPAAASMIDSRSDTRSKSVQVITSSSEVKTIKTTHKRTPVDAKELISEEEVK